MSALIRPSPRLAPVPMPWTTSTDAPVPELAIRLATLSQLLDRHIISPAEYERQRAIAVGLSAAEAGNRWTAEELTVVKAITDQVSGSIGYFGSDIIDGKVLFQGDTRQGLANGHEIGEYFAKSGEVTRWTGTVFSGMPTYQIAPSFASASLFRNVTELLMLHLPSPASLIFLMLIGFFILLKALRVRTDLSVLGAIIWTFSSYFFIIIEAGHIWKFVTLAYVPPVIGGVILAYRGRYWLGGIIAALFIALQVLSNHVQMSYYFVFVIPDLV